MSTHFSSRVSLSDLAGSRFGASPIDHALSLFLADETEAALRWGAAALESDPLAPSALIVTARLLDQMGRTRAAVDGLRLAARRAVETGDLAAALAAIGDLRILGADAGEHLDDAARAFGRGSLRLQAGQPFARPSLPSGGFLEPLSPFLGGPPLASKASQILHAAKTAHEAAVGAELAPIAPLPLFSAISTESLRDLLDAFEMITVPAGHAIIREGEESGAAFIVAHGEVELARRAAHGDQKPRLALARLAAGAFFGEMALLSRLPSATSATATRPTILLVGRRDALVAVATKRPEVAVQLAAHCRRSALANLGWTSPVVAAIPVEERAALVERLQMRVFEKGERLVTDRQEPRGLHVIVSGEVAIVAREWSDRVLLATLGPGETVGEVELVLCRQAYADAVAVRPTAALFLSRDEYSSLVRDRPAILHGLYATAVRRHAETRLAFDSGSVTVDDDWLVEEESTATHLMPEKAAPIRRGQQPLPPPIRRLSREPVLPPPLRPPASVASPTPSPGSATVAASVGPTTASIHPPRTRSVAQRSIAPLTFASGLALAASAAAFILAVSVRRGPLPSQAATPSQPAAASPVLVASPAPAETQASAPVDTIASPVPSVYPVASAATASVLKVRPWPRPAVSKPRTASISIAPPSSVAAPVSSTSVVPSPFSPAPSSAVQESKLSARTSVADEFGGRE